MKQLLFVVTLAAIVVTACSKSEDKPNQNCRIESSRPYESTANFQPLTFTYDDKGRVIKASHPTFVGEIVYQNDKITTREYGAFLLDEKGRIIRGYEGAKFEYNSDGYLAEAKMETNFATMTITFTYENGNLVQSNRKSIDNDGTVLQESQTTYQYSNTHAVSLLGHENPISEWVSAPSYLAPFFGKASKNLIAKRIFVGSSYREETEYIYVKDGSGKIIRMKYKSSIGSDSEHIFTYTCE